MAPVYVACRLTSLLVCAICVFLSASNCYSLLVYDRQFLLDIRDSFVATFNPESKNSVAGPQSCSPNSTWDIPECLHSWPTVAPRRKRRRRRGKRGGIAVKLKMTLLSGGASSFVSMTTRTLGVGRCAGWRLIDPPVRWLRTIFPDSTSTIPCYPPIRVRRGGATLENLRFFDRVLSPAISDSVSPSRMALINARSLVNKTFILNDFFTTHALDFMCITETWMKVGDLSPFAELIPEGCTFFNSPRSSGRGGGLAVILKNSFGSYCHSVPSTFYSSFEVQLLRLEFDDPVLLALVYRPPHLVKDFISEFTAFMGECVTNYCNILLLGDFNIHVCCQSKPLTMEFLNLIDSFNMVQWVKDPTHSHGHTLDLVLSHGVFITDVQVFKTLISDHMPVMFSMSLPPTRSHISSIAQWTRSFSPCFHEEFSNSFNELCLSLSMESPLPDVDAEEHLSLFNTVCSEVLNTTAPLKVKKSKPKSELWLNDTIRSLRRACRRAERKWKNDKLQISYEMLKNSLSAFQKAMKSAKSKYFSNLILKNHHSSKALFSVLKSALNPPITVISNPSVSLCEGFCDFKSFSIIM